MKKLFLIIAILISVNANAQWVQVGSGMGTYVFSLAANDSNIFAGLNSGGVYKSTNNGLNWTQTSLNNQQVYAVVTIGNNIFAGTGGNGVYLSTNNGTNWTQTSLNNKNVYSLKTLGNTIVAGAAYDGVYLSTDYGTTWTQTSYILPYQWVWCVAVDGNNILSGSNGISLSTNYGTNWTNLGLNEEVRSIGINGNTVFAGVTNHALYKSTNYGADWTWILFNVTASEVHSIATCGDSIFVGLESNGVYYSSNNGISWFPRNQGFFINMEIYSLLISKGYIIAGHYGQIYRRSLSEITGIQTISTETPSKYSLSQNYPNPFNPTTNIKFNVAKLSDIKIVVYDVTGREVQTLVNESLQHGTYETMFDGSMLNSGVYFYKFITNGFTESKKMLLIK